MLKASVKSRDLIWRMVFGKRSINRSSPYPRANVLHCSRLKFKYNIAHIAFRVLYYLILSQKEKKLGFEICPRSAPPFQYSYTKKHSFHLFCLIIHKYTVEMFLHSNIFELKPSKLFLSHFYYFKPKIPTTPNVCSIKSTMTNRDLHVLRQNDKSNILSVRICHWLKI
jgi:hypothetical protein